MLSISKICGPKTQLSLLIMLGYLSIAMSETCMSQGDAIMPYLMPCDETNMEIGSGDGTDFLTPFECPQPYCINITWEKPNLVVEFGLSCLPQMSSGCQYNYTVEFFPPNSSNLLSFDNRMISEMELNRTQFILSPSLLLKEAEYFEPGVVVNVTIFVENGNDTSGQFIIDGDFAPSVLTFNATSATNTTIDLEWTLPFPTATPDSYTIRYDYTRQEGMVNVSGEGSVEVSDGSATSHTLSNLEPFSLYGISMVTVYSGIESENDTVTIGTLEGVSSSVEDLSVNTDNQQLLITWAEPIFPAGVILSYEVTITREGSPNITSVNETVFEFISNDFDFFTDYNISVTPINGFGRGISATELVTTPQGAPSSPQGFSLQPVENDPNSLMASWIEPMDLNGILTNYTVYCCLSSDQFYLEQEPSGVEQFTVRTSVDPTSTSATVTGLQPFTIYDCYVTASTNGGQSEPSNVDSVRTVEAQSSAPTNFTIEEVTATTITVSWNRPDTPNGEITEYILGYDNSSLPGFLNISIPVTYSQTIDEYNVTGATIDQLNEFTMYRLFVAATNSEGAGLESFLDVTTNEAAPSAPPMNLMGVNTSSTSIFISWDPPPMNDQNGIILGYNVTYSSTNEGTRVVSTTNTNITLIDLSVFTDYTISVVAYTSVGSGPSTEEIIVRTDSSVPEIPQNIDVMNISSTTVEITWDPPTTFNGPNEGYEVTYRRIETNETTTIFVMDVSLNITGLEMYELYAIQIVALSDKGPGDVAEILIRTDEDLPGIVRMLEADELNSNTILVEWEPPLDPNGIVTSYQVEYSTMNMVLNVNVTVDGSMLLSVELKNLNVFSEYQIRVRAFTRVGAGNYTEFVTVKTDPAPSGPVTVTTTPDKRSITLTWTAPDMPNGIIEGYYISTNATFPPDVVNSTLDLYGAVLNVSINTLSIEFTGLTPFTYYQFSVAAYSFNPMDSSNNFTILIGNFSSDTISQTLEDSPSSPQGFSLQPVENDPNSLMASWTEPMDLNGILTNYTVYCRLSSDQFYPEQEPSGVEQFTVRTSVDPTNTSATVTGLQPFTIYDCYVTASTNGGQSEPSNNESARTVEDTPSVPTNFTIEEVTATTITVSWNRPDTPNGEITEYILGYDNSSLPGFLNISIPVTYSQSIDEYNVTGATIDQLNEFTMYRLLVAATNSEGAGLESFLDVTTNEAAPSAPPRNLMGVNTSSTSIFISWDPPPVNEQNGIILGYHVTYSSTNESTKVVSTANTNITLIDLSVFTDYTISVVAYTSVGSGPSTEEIIVRTDSSVPEIPQNIDVMNISSTTVEITWDPPTTFNGPNEGYEVTYRRIETDETTTISVMGVSLNITGLEMYELYAIQIVALSDKGPGDVAEILIRTDEDLPGIVRMLEADELSSDTILVEWEPPLDPNGIITSYQVEYSTMDMVLNVTVDGSMLLSVELKNLNVFSEYQIRVRALTRVGAGNYTDFVTVKTDPAPSGPVTVTATPDRRSITLTWTAPGMPNGIIEGYYISTNASFPPNIANSTLDLYGTVLNVSNTTLSIEFTGLTPFTYYQFSVAAYSFNPMDSSNNFTILVGNFSPDTISQTLEDLPSVVQDFSADEIDLNSIIVEWSQPLEPNGIITLYQVEYTQVGNSTFIKNVSTDTLTGPPFSTTLDNLVIHTEYDIRIRAFTSAGPGNFTTNAIVRTDPAPASPPVNVQAIPTEDTVTLTWEAPLRPHGVIRGYYVSTNATFPTDLDTAMISSMSGEVLNITDQPNSVVFTGLTPFTVYRFTVAGYSFNLADDTSNFSILIGNFSDFEITQTLEDAPSSPQGFSLQPVENDPNSLMASWTEPMDLNGILTNYTVYCRLSSDQFYPEQEPSGVEQFTVRTSVDPTSTSATVTGLQPFTIYDCYVTASTDGGQSEPSNNKSARTVEDTPSAPTNFTVQEVTATNVTVSWNRPDTPNGEINTYLVQYFNSSLSMDPLTISIPVTYLRDINEFNVTSLTIYDLNEFTMYTVNIAAINGQETGPIASLNFTTNESAPSAPPMNLTGVNTSSTSIFISWDLPLVNDRNGIILGYNVTYSSTNEDTRVVSTANTNITLIDLSVFTDYTVSVVAYTSVGSGPSTEEIIVRTDSDIPFKPSNVTISFVNATTLIVEWAPPTVVRGLRMGYILRYRLSPYDYSYLLTNYTPVMLGVDTFSRSLNMLHEFAEYVIILQAVNDKGPGDNVTITQTTDQSVPGTGVRNIVVDVLNSTAVNVSWFPPLLSDWNGILTNYTVSYQSMDNIIGSSINGSLIVLPSRNGGNPRFAPDPLLRESITISGLEEAIEYSFTVTVSTDIGPNLAADTVLNSTDEDVPSTPPLDVRVTVLSSLSANITWSPPSYLDRNGIILGYGVNISDSSGDVLVSQRVDGGTNYYLAEDLPQFATFNVIVSALTSQGLGPASTPESGMTLEGFPSEPINVTLSAASQTSIRVTWVTPSPPNGIIIGYHIFYYGQKLSGDIFEGLYENLTATVSRGDATSYILTGLLSDTYYSMNVTAFTARGNGTTGIGGEVYLPRGDPPTLPPNSTFSIAESPTDDSGTAPAPSTSTIPITFEIPGSLSANGPIRRLRIICRAFGSTTDILSNYYLSSMVQLPDIPPYFAIEVKLGTSNGRRLAKRQDNEDMTISETIGTELNCGVNDEICNGPLRAGTEYQFKYRAYNSEDDDSYVESQYSAPISTAQQPSSNTTLIIAVVVVIVAVIISVGVVTVIIVIVIRRRKKRKLYSFAGNGTSETLIKEGSSKAKLINAGPSIVPLSENISATKDSLKPVSVKATPHSRKIYLRDLPGYVSDMISDSGFKFSEEYEKVSAVGLDHSRDASLLPENRAKNRYTNILAYDHSRVKLDYVDDEPGSDYINANYIPGYKIRRAYIASQGPLPSTFDDFWTMVWQQNVHNIVMLTQLVERGRTKCHRYWPGSQPEVYGDITVEMTEEHEDTDWVIRTFELIKEKRCRTVKQFQFISWPDHGVPETATAALDFVTFVHSYVQGIHGPVLVHCSAGVGRTGTFIALGTLLHHIKDHDWVDIFGLACEMRQHRNHMIQTEAQYIFIHKAMVEICQSLSTFSDGKKLQGFNPIYINIGAGMSPDVSQQSDYMFGNSLLSEETTQFTNTMKSYDESKF